VDEVSAALQVNRNELIKYLDALEKEGTVQRARHNERVYFVRIES